MEYCKFIQPDDIALRLMWGKIGIWPKMPTVSLTGAEGTFGSLVFDFTEEGEDEDILVYGVFIKDYQKILRAANYTIENYRAIVRECSEGWDS